MIPLTDDVLIELYKHTAASLSYYNAIESAGSSIETDARTLARHAYYAAKSELVFRKLPIPKGPWLI